MVIDFSISEDLNNWDNAMAIIEAYRQYCEDNTYHKITDENMLEIIDIISFYLKRG